MSMMSSVNAVIRECSNFTIRNSVLNNIQGNATIIRFGDGTLSRSVIEDYMRGVTVLPPVNTRKMEKDSLIRLIRHLPRAEAAYNDYQSQKKNGLCLKGTRETLLGELGSWLDDPTKSRIYVLSGLAGIGKSTIAYTFASRADKLGIIGASFFFSRDESDRKTAKKFFTTIAYQLCLYDKAFAKAIGDALLNGRGSAAITKGLNEQLEALILEPLRDVVKSRVQPTVIVIDALDECDDRDATTVLASLERLVQTFPSFKVLLTTRPQPHLDHRLRNHDVFYLQNIEDKVINNDIRLYLKSSLSRDNVADCLPDLIDEWSADDEKVEYLVTAAGKLFIVASTAVRLILDTTAHNPASQMQLLMVDSKLRFNDLESFYVVILQRALPAKCSIKIAERFKTIIGAILFIQEPLPVTALQHFTLTYSLDDIVAVLKDLKSVITDEHTIPRIYHKSFSDFLTETCHKHFDIHIISESQHKSLANCCFRILNKHLKRNILNLAGPGRFMDNTAGLERQGISDDRFRERISLELDYACSYWAIHLQGASIDNFDTGHQELVQELSIFANDHLLHWIEAMSWICKLDLACRALRDVHVLLNSKSTSGELREMFSDALRFISKFYLVIQRSALHTYYSALSFTPTETLLYKRYQKETIGNIYQVAGVPKKWGDVIAHPNHEEVDQVLFSQDSSMFASLSGRHTKFWDAVTGAPMGTIVDKVSAITDDFSTAASYNDSTITLHDVNSCTSLATLSVAPASIVKLAISPDGCRLAAALSDDTVCLWNWKSVDPVAQFTEFAWDKERHHCYLSFNSSGDRLVFESDDGMMLRNGISGEFVAEMKHVKSKCYPSCVAFSRDGSRLAYRDQGQLLLLDGEAGTLIANNELKEPGSMIAISGDGTLIAIDQGLFIMLWNLNSMNSLKVYRSIKFWERPSMSSIAFHHDSVFVTIRTLPGVFRNAVIHDVELCVRLYWKNGLRSWHRDRHWQSWNFFRHLKYHQNRSFDFIMGVSSDNTRAIIGSSAASLQLLDFGDALLRPPRVLMWRNPFMALWSLMVYGWKESGSVPHRLATPVTRLHFSPDCLRLASCHDDGTIGLWDTSCTRQLITTLKFPGWKVESCVFSADGSHLVSASFGSTIELWDCRKGLRFGTLKPEYPTVTSMVFLRGMLAVRSQTDHDSDPPKSDITLWNIKTLRPIVTVTNDSSELSELFHHDTMLVYYKERRLSEDIYVIVWDAEKRAPHAAIPMASLPNSVEGMVMSPDKSKLVMQLDDGNLKSFDLINGSEEIMLTSRREDLDWDWLPPTRSWHGVPVWLHQSTDNGTYCVSARSRDGVLIPLLWIEGVADLGVHHVARGSSMFALRYDFNHIIVLRQSPTGSFD
ncbi:hypothetical protein JOM56_008965 [Amanita muscaria]